MVLRRSPGVPDQMTDLSADAFHLVARLGVTARSAQGLRVLEMVPRPEVLHHGVVRASVLSFLVDAAAGVIIDDDSESWAFTSDMSVRMRPIPAPERIEASATVLRRGRRSATATVELTADGDTPVATGAIGFAKLPRRETDPPKPQVSRGGFAAMFRGAAALTKPLREEAGIVAVEPTEGVVEVTVTPELHNPAGTLQGALVALVAEAAAEDLVSSRFEAPVVVTDLDLRYLAQAPVGPVRSRCRLLGTGPDAPVEVELVDTSANRLTTLVYARATTALP
jgi:acyl-coenzyme A thioesterase PaaI-like protein